MQPFANMVPRIKVNYLKQRTVKKKHENDNTSFQGENIYCLFKMNPEVTYEIDHFIFDHEIIFILSRAENVQNRNFWKQ